MRRFRFSPPTVSSTAELDWLVGAAFGCGREWIGKELDGGEVLKIGCRLDLFSRIGALRPQHDLNDAIGDDTAGEVLSSTRATASQALKVRAIAKRVGEIASIASVEGVVVKGGALLLLDIAAPGARNVGDLDFLVDRAVADRLQAALIDGGWNAGDVPGSRHQLPILWHSSGVCVEVHTELPGVRFGGANATFYDVVAAGQCGSLASVTGGSRVAGRQLLIAHLVAHGIHQHGLAPDAYPMARMIGDVQDLVSSQQEWDEFITEGFNWISHVVSRREAEAVWAVVDRLRRGDDPASIMGGDDDAGRLLRHVVAGALNEEYRQSLKLQDAVRASGDSSWLNAGKKALFLTRGQIDVVYGKPATEVGYWGRRIWRPFDLVMRACRYGWAWVKQRMRNR